MVFDCEFHFFGVGVVVIWVAFCGVFVDGSEV